MTDPDAAPHGGESLTALLARVRAWLEEQAALDGTAIAITHGGVVKAAVVAALDAPPSAFWRIDVSPLVDHRAPRPRRPLDRHPRERPRRGPGADERRRGGARVTAAGIALGVGADALFGDPRRLHPVAGFGQAAAAFERVVYRPTRRAGRRLRRRCSSAARRCSARRSSACCRARWRAGVALYVALGGRSLAREAQAVADLVERDEIDGRAGAHPLARRPRPASTSTATELCAAVIESVAENTVDAVIAPLFWVAVAGAPGVLAHRAVNTLDAMVGHRNERYARFGTAAARADDVANWPAARLAAALTVRRRAAAGARGARGATAPRRTRARTPGVIEAAFAGALGLRLGGTLAYAGRVEHRPQLGTGRAPGPGDVARAVRLARVISLATAVLAMGAAMKGALLVTGTASDAGKSVDGRRDLPLAQAPGRHASRRSRRRTWR